MKRRISTILLLSGTIILILSMLLSTISFAAPPQAPLTVPSANGGCNYNPDTGEGSCKRSGEGCVDLGEYSGCTVTGVCVKAGSECSSCNKLPKPPAVCAEEDECSGPADYCPGPDTWCDPDTKDGCYSYAGLCAYNAGGECCHDISHITVYFQCAPPPDECGEACTEGSCVEGLTCIDSVCRNPACPEDPDCVCAPPPDECGEACTEGSCVEGLTCIDSVCRNPACPEDPDCVCAPPPDECGEACTEGSCVEGLTCIDSVCRNPACPEDPDCVCPVVGCDYSCTVDADCEAGLVCSGAYCRNPDCTDETDCICAVAPVLSADGGVNCKGWSADFYSDVTANYYVKVSLDRVKQFEESGTFNGHKSFGDAFDLCGPHTMSISYYASVGAKEVGDRESYERDCGTCGPGPAPTPVPLVVPTPTPIVEVAGVERLPVTGEMPLAPMLPTLAMIGWSLTLIGGGLVLRRND